MQLKLHHILCLEKCMKTSWKICLVIMTALLRVTVTVFINFVILSV